MWRDPPAEEGKEKQGRAEGQKEENSRHIQHTCKYCGTTQDAQLKLRVSGANKQVSAHLGGWQ